MRTTSKLNSAAVLGFIAATSIVGGCADKAVSPGATPRARVRVEAAIAAQASTARSVDITVNYAQASGSRITIAEQTDEIPAEAIVAGTKDVTLDVNLQQCLADPDRAGSGNTCTLFVHIILIDGNGVTLDSTDAGPVSATVGATADPVTLTVRAASSITLTPAGPDTAVVATRSVQYSAQVRDASGTALSRLVIWTSSDTAIAQVSQTGNVTASRPGSTTITARTTGASASRLFQVRAAVPTTVLISSIVTPGTSVPVSLGNLHVGQAVQIVVTVTAEPPTPTTVVWSSTNGAIAVISAQGIATLVGQGTVNICATSTANFSSSACFPLTVLP